MSCSCCGAVKTAQNQLCDLCTLFDRAPGRAPVPSPTAEAIAELETIIGPHRERSNAVRWRRLAEHAREEGSVNWILHPDPQARPTCEKVSLSDYQLHLDSLESSEGRRRDGLVQRGFQMPDGTFFSAVGGIWAVDGKRTKSIPFHALLRMLVSPRAGEPPAVDVNWRSLIDIVQSIAGLWHSHGLHPRHARYLGARNPMADRIQLLQNRYDVRIFSEHARFIFWVMDNLPEERRDHVQQEVLDAIEFEDALQIIRRESQHLPHPWVDAWNEVDTRDLRNVRHRTNMTRNLRVTERGELQVYLQRDGRWRWSKVPASPTLWAWLCSLAMAPAGSPAAALLHAFQWSWREPVEALSRLADPPLKRSIQLVRSIVDGNENISVKGGERGGILVKGTSENHYLIELKLGAHGAPFMVRAAREAEDLFARNEWQRLCLHEDRDGRRLPLGDIIATVLLTLLDDERSAQTLAPLADYIRTGPIGGRMWNHGREGVLAEEILRRRQAEMEAQQRRLRRQIERARYLGPLYPRRMLQVFPRFFDAITYAAPGDLIQLPEGDEGQVTLHGDRCHVEIRDQEERELVIALLRVAGWVPIERAEPDQITWMRDHAPVPERIRTDLVEALGPFNERHAARGDPPWWTHFTHRIPLNADAEWPERLRGRIG